MTTDDALGGGRPHRPLACPEWADRILEADPATLAGDGDGELAAHLRACGRCAAAADRLLEASGHLARALASPAGGVDAAGLVARGMARRRAARRDRSRWSVAGLLAAAAVAALFLAPRGPRPTPPPDRPPPGLDLVVSGDVAVLSGADSDITILWFFDAEGGAP